MIRKLLLAVLALMMLCSAAGATYSLPIMPGEMPRLQALDLALTTIEARYGVACRLEDARITDYAPVAPGSATGMWRFGVMASTGQWFEVHVCGGEVTYCAEIPSSSSLDAEYTALCEERGAFFTWTLAQKAEYAARLPAKLQLARQLGVELMQEKDFTTIAAQGFCMPTENEIPQETARAIAADAVQRQFSLPDGWDGGETYYSFFRGEGPVWRVIFWQTGCADFPAGVVDMDAATGEVFRLERNGGTAQESIPYWERM